jgi:hypothetical protein
MEKHHIIRLDELLLHEQLLRYCGIFMQEHTQPSVSHMSEHFRQIVVHRQARLLHALPC